MRVKSLKEIDVYKKRVLLRVDFNVALDSQFQVTEETRIIASLPTIRYLLKKKAQVILVFHLGRPKGKVDRRLSAKPVAEKLAQHLKQKVALIEDFWKKEAVEKVKSQNLAQVVMLENIRFHPGEEQNDRSFSRHLASFADVFVNDAFGTAHRAHASTVGVTEFLPSCAGFLLEKEIKILSRTIRSPKRPLVVIIGGAKTPEKIAVIEKFLERADVILLGGAIANTFFCTWGIGTGSSLVDHEMIEAARVCFWKATRRPVVLLLPIDVVIINSQKTKEKRVVNYKNVPKNYAICDIGPQTRRLYGKYIQKAKSIIWNGPMGIYEKEEFAYGTNFLLRKVSQSSAFSILGGGDTLASIREKELMRGFSYLSTGGGAMLGFLEKGTLPAIEPLWKR